MSKKETKSGDNEKKLATSSNNTKTISVENLQFTKVNAFKPKGTKTSSCGFCGDPGHRISRCGKKKSFGAVQDGSVLSTYLLNTAPFSLLNKDEARELINDDVSSRRGVKHMIVHSLHMKWQCDPTIRPRLNELAARITFLNQVGEPLGGYDRSLVDLMRVVEYIYMQIRVKRGGFCFQLLIKKVLDLSFPVLKHKVLNINYTVHQ